jgi:Glycosyltransferase family 87
LSHLLRLLVVALTGSGWVLLIARAGQSIVAYAIGPDSNTVWLYDWRVYYAGALDLVQRHLYRDAGISVGKLAMPVVVFNNPPMAAAVPIPLLPFGYEFGGLIWVLAGATALLVSTLGAARITHTSFGLAWFGIFWLIYATQPFFPRTIVIGNVNNFMLALVVGFVWAHLEGHQRLAGIVLGLAVAIKVWPVMIGFLLIREKRWLELAWAGGFVAAQGLIIIAWLGPDVLPSMVGALRTVVPIPAGVVVLWTTWARETLTWWPTWGSIAVAGLLVAIPVRGRLGLGLTILAGLSLIANLWDHYLPTFAFAGLLIVTSAREGSAGRQTWQRIRRRMRRIGGALGQG